MCATTQSMRNMSYSEEYKGILQAQKKILQDAIIHIQQRTTKEGRLKALLEFDQEERFPSYILRRVDHLSMANAVEVRVPFCQPKITSFANSLTAEYQLNQTQVKRVIYQAARSLLPESIINRPKHFFVLPIVEMLSRQHILFDILNDTLSSQAFRNRGFFNYKIIQTLMKEQFKNPNNDTANLLWSVMILELWLVKMGPMKYNQVNHNAY
jgi:asparagine synthase (glutamine-hydrolysing)